MKQPLNFARRSAAGLPPARGLYNPAFEHDGCGIGFIARLDARPDHRIVEDAVRILVNLEHRGAVGGDLATGDGAGLLLPIPDAFLRAELGAAGDAVAGASLVVRAIDQGRRMAEAVDRFLRSA